MITLLQFYLRIWSDFYLIVSQGQEWLHQWNRGEARILYIIRLLAVRWAGSYNDNVLSALPWVRRPRPWWNKLLGIRGPSSGRHGREVLLAAHFVSVLCVVLRDFRKIWIHIISIHMFIWIHMQNKNSLPMTDHVNCASWRFFGFYFFSVRGTKTFFFRFRTGK